MFLTLLHLAAVSTAILPDDWNIFKALVFVVDFLTFGIGAAATVGFVISGYTYLTARDNPSQVAKAKTRMFQIVVGIAIWAVFYGVANWLLPGGKLNSTEQTLTIAEVQEPTQYTKVDVTQPTTQTPTTPTQDTPTQDTPTQDTPTQQTGSCKDGVSKGSTSYYRQYGNTTVWKGGNYPNSTISNSGCPMMAAMNATIKVTGCKYNPTVYANHMKTYTNNFSNRKGLFSSDSDWSNLGWNIVNHYLDYYGVNHRVISGQTAVTNALQAGHAVVVGGKRTNDSVKIFSKGGHYIALVGISGNNITVANPANGGATITTTWSNLTGNATNLKFTEVY